MCVCVILYECRMCVSGVCNSDFRSRRPSVSMIIHVYTPKSWWRLNQRVVFASHSAKLAISIRAPLFVRSVVLFASHSEKLAISLIFASHSEKLAISIRAPFFEHSVFYLCDFLCAQHLLFASHSEKLAISIRAPF